MALNASLGTWHEVNRSAAALPSSTPGFLFFEFLANAEPGRIAYRLDIATSSPDMLVACLGNVIGL
jgi:hypothetical protein